MRDEQSNDLETLLIQLRDLLDSARSMPMSASVLVNRDEALDLVEQALRTLPQELRHARWLLKERDAFLSQAQRDADELVDAARAQAARLVDRTELAREAQNRARRVMDEADGDARRLRHETEDYIDQKLAAFEAMLAKTLGAVQRGRQQLQPQLEPLDDEDVGELDGAASGAVFDQDEY
jgi:hypothetical protein